MRLACRGDACCALPDGYVSCTRRYQVQETYPLSQIRRRTNVVITQWNEVAAGVTYPEGFVASSVRCGLKSQGADLALLVSDSAASVAGVFTTNRVQAACVQVFAPRGANRHGAGRT